jgi:hypothetical protein
MTQTKMTHDQLIAMVMADYEAKLTAEAQRRQAIREGRLPAPEGQWGELNISDRH